MGFLLPIHIAIISIARGMCEASSTANPSCFPIPVWILNCQQTRRAVNSKSFQGADCRLDLYLLFRCIIEYPQALLELVQSVIVSNTLRSR
ncbi:hypothetical protein BKA61DRAFT_588296 [Leptodontidium sp. MPI-SDFR-AT-0119]|nr:hypothetical protein BKA61DRAFT_588296 [Leptodontidium sp. MPI-SDFR-AT-0119]